jgi:dipeptidyl-peptidase 4
MFVKKNLPLVTAIAIAASGLCCTTTFAQQPRQYTDQDYAAAEKFMGYNVNPLAYKGVVHAQWLDDDRFWYRAVDDSGVTYMIVEPAKGTRRPSIRASWQRRCPPRRMTISRATLGTSGFKLTRSVKMGRP